MSLMRLSNLNQRMSGRSFKRGEKLGPKGETVLREFSKGKLRTPTGKKITQRKQAVAVAFSEQRAARKRGTSRRTFKGRTRIRPKLKKS